MYQRAEISSGNMTIKTSKYNAPSTASCRLDRKMINVRRLLVNEPNVRTKSD